MRYDKVPDMNRAQVITVNRFLAVDAHDGLCRTSAMVSVILSRISIQ